MTLLHPGCIDASSSGFVNTKEMWKYYIHRDINALSIIPNISNITINKVTINGETTSPENVSLYRYKACDALDVVVEYTINNEQDMTTHYDAAFNAQLPNTEYSGIENIVIDTQDSFVEIFNLTGVKIYEGYIEEASQIQPGIYIVKTANSVSKIIIE